jgi:integrase
LRNHISPVLGERVLAHITPSDITAVIDSLHSKGAKYRVNVYALLRVLFDIAEETDLIARSPVRSKIHRPDWIKEEKPTLSSQEVRELLNNVPDQYRLLVLLTAVTGLRQSEVLGFRWQDFDEEGGSLSITQRLWRGKLGPTKTRQSRARLQLSAPLIDALKTHRQSSAFATPTDFIFCRSDGEPFDPDWFRRKVLYRAMDSAGIKRGHRTHGFHILRHTAASLLHDLTGDLKWVQEFLRHSQISTTADVYVHKNRAVSRAASELLAGEIGTTTFESSLVH